MLAPIGHPPRSRDSQLLLMAAALLVLLLGLLQTTPSYATTWALSNPQPAQVPAGSYVHISFDADNPPGPSQFQFDVFDELSGEIKHAAVDMTCTGTKCSGWFSTTLWAMAPPNTTVTVYNYGPWVGWTQNPSTTFQITEPTWGDITPTQFARGAGWTPLSFESNLLGSVSVEYSYTVDGQTVTAPPVGASCADGVCQLSINIPDTADYGPNGELWLLENPVLTNRQTFSIIRPPITFSPPYIHPEIPWGPLLPTKWPRGSHTYPVVLTDVSDYLQVGVWILYATADAPGWTAQPTALFCGPATPYEPSVCSGGGWVPPANATTWGCVRKAQADEDIANLDPAIVRGWMDDPGSCLPFQIVEYTLPYITSVTPSTITVNSGDLTLTLEGEWGTTDSNRTYIGFGEFDEWGGLPWYASPQDVISQTLTKMVVRVPGSLITTPGPKTVQLYDVYDDMPTATFMVVEAPAHVGLTSSAPVQSGDTVIVTIDWTQAVPDGVIDCGTIPVQQHLSSPASCVFSTPGTYTVTGTYDGGTSADPIQVVIPSLGLEGGTASTRVLGQTTDTFVAYAFPIPVDLSVTFTQAEGIGIPDRLDLGASHITIAQEGEPPTSVPITERNGTTYGGRVHLGASGTYNLSITGQTLAGHPISASATIAILGATLTLVSSPLAQNGNSVSLPVSWPVVEGVTPQSIDCGTTPSQAILGASGECAYTKAGSYTIQGRFTDAFGTAGIHTAPIPVTVPSLGLQPQALTTQVLGQTVSQFTTYSFPVPVTLSTALYQEPGVGIPEALDLGHSTITLTPASGDPITVAIESQGAQTYGGQAQIPAGGIYTVILNGQTQTGAVISTTTELTIDAATATLHADTLVQAGPAVRLPVSWPTIPGLSAFTVDCGTTANQSFSGTTGICVYTRPGTYTVQGRFADALGNTAIPTDPVTITVPAIPPGPGQLRAAPANGQSPTHDLSGPVPIGSYGSPTVYPVPFQLSLTFDAPVEGQVGVPDSLDAANSTIHLRPVAAPGDLTTPASPDDTLLAVQDCGDGMSFRASGSLTSFPPIPGDPSRWRQRFLLEGLTLTGIPVSAELYLDGPIGDGSTIQYTWERIDPIYPYAPAAYRYVLSGLHSPIPGEPMTQTWVGDNQTQIIQGDGSFDALFTTAGSKTVTLAANGPLSGTKHQIDQPVILPTPPGTIAFTITPPKYNRPLAQYRFAPNYPPLQPGEKLVGSPTWFIDGVRTFTGTPFYYTFSTPGTFEAVVSQPTTSRTLYGRTIVTVNANQPPSGSIDCSASSIVKTTNPWSYMLSCKAVNAVDADGRISSMVWALPDLGVSKSGSTYWNYSLPTAQAVRVQLILTDDSGGVTTLEKTVDLRVLR